MVKKGKSRTTSSNATVPFVSVCTPTFNRRPFIPAMIANFLRQDYPHNRMEWIIIDDGTDKVGDLLKDVPCVKYFSYDKKMSLGKKRNLMHEKSCGEILVYMDDDDYYPACRVSHAVDMLLTHPKALCAGSSEIYIWFNDLNRMVQFGPYGPNHATAGTFAFKRKLLKDHKYENDAALAEEKAFLKNYTVPFVQLNPLKTILVFSHDHNTFDKRKLLENPHPDYVRDSTKTVDMFVSEPEAKEFYTKNIIEELRNYEPGRPEMKPDVLEQTKQIELKRRLEMEKMMKEMNDKDFMNKNGGNYHSNKGKIIFTLPDGSQKEATNDEIVGTLRTQNSRLDELEKLLEAKETECNRLRGLNKLLMKRMQTGGAGNERNGLATAVTVESAGDDRQMPDADVEDLSVTDADVIADELFS